MQQAIKIFFLFGAMIVFNTVTAQETGLFNKNLDETSNRLGGKLTGEVYYFSLLENSNYFINPDWVDGSITLKNGEVFDRLKLRYMAFGDQLVVYNTNNKILFKVDKNTVRTFSFKDKVYGINDFERTFINLDSA